MTNEILIARIEERLSYLKENLDEKLDRIEEQTTKTNGRVSTLEGKVDHLQAINIRRKGQWDSLVIMAAIIGFILGAALEYLRP